MAPGRPHQLSDLSLHSKMDAGQSWDGLFHFWVQIGFFYLFAILTRLGVALM